MRRSLLLLALTFAVARAQGHAHHHQSVSPLGDAHIVVTINPEARVSAALGAPLPSPDACGSIMELKVKVINNGFVTAPLRAAILGDGVRQVALHMDSTKLAGIIEESRALLLIPLRPDAIDVTIEFGIDNNIGDHGGRDRIHLLLQCY
jgi:hypothetical protein